MMNYKNLGQEIGKLVDDKNKAYGGISRVAEAMQIFYPNGISFDKLTDALLIVRILDKINRISGGDKAAFSENPFKDLAGYSILGCGVDQVKPKMQDGEIEKYCNNCKYACWPITKKPCIDCEKRSKWEPMLEVVDRDKT